MTEPDLEIPEFDLKRTRGAVRRGILRTAVVTLGALLVLVLLATVGSHAIQTRGDREERMLSVLGTAIQLANPGYRFHTIGPCCETTPFTLSFEVTAMPLRADGGFSAPPAVAGRTDRVVQDFFGRVRAFPLGYYTETSLTYALYDLGTGNPAKDTARKVLQRLPDDLNALAVVEFAAPLTPEQLTAFAKRYDGCPELAVYENRPRATPITWGTGILAHHTAERATRR